MNEIDIFKRLLEEEERRKAREKPLVNRIEIFEVLPCLTTPGYIRFRARADGELREVIPVLFLMFPPGRSHYNRAEGTLTLNILNRMITFHPGGEIAVTNTKDLKEAEEILEKMRGLINDAYSAYIRFGAPGDGEVEAAMRISWMDLYNHLPRINCGECGLATCQALAIKALLGEAKLSQCKKLRDSEYLQLRMGIKNRLGPYLSKALGLEA